MNRTHRLLTIVTTCTCLLSFLANIAQAQGRLQPGGNSAAGNNAGRGRGGRAIFEPSVTTEELDRYGKMVNMTKAQSEAAKALYDAYEHEYTAAATKARDEIAAIREEARDNPSRFRDIGELFTRFRENRTAMETSFFNDVKATLTPAQAATWPVVERTRRRETTMDRGMMSGERADLVRIVDGLKLTTDARKPLDPILDQYQVDLDRQLIARNEVMDKMQGNFRNLLGGDPAQAQKMIDESRAASSKVRDVNMRYSRQIEGALPDDATKTGFDEAVRRESFPQIYRGQSNAVRAADSALALDGVTPEQKTSINEIKDRFNREYGALSRKMEAAYQQREATITAADVMGRMGGGGGWRGQGGRFGMVESGELNALRDQRRELETTTVDKIRAQLNEEQKAKLPARDNGAGDGGGNGAGRNNSNRPANNQHAPSGRT